MRELIADCFEPSEVTVVTGSVEQTTALLLADKRVFFSKEKLPGFSCLEFPEFSFFLFRTFPGFVFFTSFQFFLRFPGFFFVVFPPIILLLTFFMVSCVVAQTRAPMPPSFAD